MSITSMCSSIGTVLPLPFLLIGVSNVSSFTMLSCFVDDLVKGLLALALSATDGEEKSNLLPFEPVALVDGVSTDFGAGLGETSLCGE
jgi:hypothetical protein